jgi:PIN domain nuclease of toxin-antitoxin system
MTSQGLLFDTCAILYIANKSKIADAARAAFEQAFDLNQVYISPVSALEIGQLSSRKRDGAPADPFRFFYGFSALAGVSLCSLSPDLLLHSSYLPNWRHKDPMDRILVATALKHDLTLATRDREILAYGAQGHVKTLAC